MQTHFLHMHILHPCQEQVVTESLTEGLKRAMEEVHTTPPRSPDVKAGRHDGRQSIGSPSKHLSPSQPLAVKPSSLRQFNSPQGPLEAHKISGSPGSDSPATSTDLNAEEREPLLSEHSPAEPAIEEHAADDNHDASEAPGRIVATAGSSDNPMKDARALDQATFFRAVASNNCRTAAALIRNRCVDVNESNAEVRETAPYRISQTYFKCTKRFVL